MPIEIIDPFRDESHDRRDSDTPQFDNERLLSFDKIKEIVVSPTAKKQFTTESPSFKASVVAAVDSKNASKKARRGTVTSEKEQQSFLGLKIENSALSNKKSSI